MRKMNDRIAISSNSLGNSSRLVDKSNDSTIMPKD